ncbi:MAG: hypothetical protein M0T69_02180 [Deltaproteobacteria bacterium]|nr:hypothetical protein [Deltaproteobacteria bacterium]
MATEATDFFTLTGAIKAGFSAGVAWAAVFFGNRQIRKENRSMKKEIDDLKGFRHQAEQVISGMVNLHEVNHPGQRIKIPFKRGDAGNGSTD